MSPTKSAATGQTHNNHALPFSTLRLADGWIAVSGQLGLKGGELVAGGAEAETAQALTNLSEVLAGAGASLDSVVKVNVFLSSMSHYADMNRAFASAFADRVLPARTAVAVLALPRGAAVEIEAWALAGSARDAR